MSDRSVDLTFKIDHYKYKKHILRPDILIFLYTQLPIHKCLMHLKPTAACFC